MLFFHVFWCIHAVHCPFRVSCGANFLEPVPKAPVVAEPTPEATEDTVEEELQPRRLRNENDMSMTVYKRDLAT